MKTPESAYKTHKNQNINSNSSGNKNENFANEGSNQQSSQNKMLRLVDSRQNNSKNRPNQQFGYSTENQFSPKKFMFNSNSTVNGTSQGKGMLYINKKNFNYNSYYIY